MRIGPSGDAQMRLAPTDERIGSVVVDVQAALLGEQTAAEP